MNNTIYRIDGNRVYNSPTKGAHGYFKTREGAEKYLKEHGFYLEARKWDNICGHEVGTDDYKWYNKKLDEHGYSVDNTSYAYLKEIILKD